MKTPRQYAEGALDPTRFLDEGIRQRFVDDLTKIFEEFQRELTKPSIWINRLLNENDTIQEGDNIYNSPHAEHGTWSLAPQYVWGQSYRITKLPIMRHCQVPLACIEP